MDESTIKFDFDCFILYNFINLWDKGLLDGKQKFC